MAASTSNIAQQAWRIEAGIIIDASGAQINAQGDAFSHNTVHVLPAPPLTAEGKENNLARFQRCPLPSVIFTGREEALHKIRARLLEPSTRPRIFVLYGLGGAGKSQIAFQFVHTHCYGNNPNVKPSIPIALFIDASTKDTIELSLTKIAVATGIGNSPEDVLLLLPYVKREWLLIFDNADDPELDLSPYFPRCIGGNILITTRNARDTARQYTDKRPSSSYEVGRMASEDAALMLCRATGKDEDGISDTVKALTKELGFLPLAISQAGAAIQRQQSNIEDYRQQLNIHSAQLFENDRVRPQDLDGYTQSIYTTWYSNYRSLSDVGRSLFNICTFLHHDGITEDIFSRAAVTCSSPDLTFKIPLDSATSNTLQEVKNLLMNFMDPSKGYDSFRFKDLFGELRSYSLVQSQFGICLQPVQPTPLLSISTSAKQLHPLCEDQNQFETYSIHPLVQTWAQKIAPDGIQHQTVLLLGLSVLDEEAIDTKLWRSLIPHLDQALNKQTVTAIPDFAAIEFGKILHEAGRYKDAAVYDRHCLERRKEILEENHPSTLNSMGKLATTLAELGKSKEAEELKREVLERRKETLGEFHPDTLMSMANLARTLADLGKSREAEELQREVLERRQEILGENHPSTLRSMANLARTLADLGKSREAEELEGEVLEGRKEILGNNHPSTLTSMANLASTLTELGKNKEAKELKREVLERRKEILGENHPDTLTSMANLAVTLTELGKSKEAEGLQREVLERRKEILGENHPDILMSMANLAVTLIKLGKSEEAEELEREVLKRRKEILGENHPSTLMSMANLARTFAELGKSEEAEELEREVLARRKEILGENHPDTLMSMANLAVTLTKLGKSEEAEELQREVLERRQEILGENHPSTLRSMANLARTLADLGKSREAEELEGEVLGRKKEILGENHPSTLISMANLASTMAGLGKNKEAEELEREVLERRKEILGENHPDTLTSMANLATTLAELGKSKEAEGLQREVLERRKEILGENHSDTLMSKAKLAATLAVLGKRKKAEELEREVLERREDVLPETIEARWNQETTNQPLQKPRDKTLLGKLKGIVCCLDEHKIKQ